MKPKIRRCLSLVLSVTALAGLLSACSDGSDGPTDGPPSPAAALLEQFGDGAHYFSEAGLEALLAFEDASSPVLLMQLMAVDDDVEFARYETAIADVWGAHGGSERFASRVTDQIVGERRIVEVRMIEFPNTPMLIDALNSEAFAGAAEALFAATSDHAWVMGIEQAVPFEPTGSFFDPSLLFRDRQEALALLAANNSGTTSIASDPEVFIDMIVSDSPEPFFMVNLIDFYESANYADGRETDLTGEEANAIYGQAIGPQLFLRNSGPEILFPVSVVLTEEERAWEQAVIVRYASRDAFLNIFALNPNAGDALIHKDAGVEETLVYVTERRWASPPEPATGLLYNYRYCEILLPISGPGALQLEVWGTQGLNRCPQADWEALDPATVASDNGAPFALFNGPRFFLVDWVSNGDGLGGGEQRLFGNVPMALLTTVQPANAGAGNAYLPARVARSNVWHFVAGRRIYELVDPAGVRYVMQSFSRIVDPDLALADLAELGPRLSLPEGWRFESRVLTESLEVPTVDGIAEVIQDDLSNTYQRVP